MAPTSSSRARRAAARPVRLRLRLTGLVAGAVLVLAACSSGSTAGGTTSAGGGSTSAGSGGSTTCVADAKAAVATYSEPMKLQVPTDKLDMKQLAGKTIWFISPTQATGYAASVSAAFQAAGEKAGVQTQIFNGNAKPDLFNQGIKQAVASQAAAIVLYAINPALVPNALQDAKNAGIPVVAVATGVPNPTDGTVVATISVDLVEEGTEMANYALMTKECNVNAAVAFDPNQKALTAQLDAIKAQFAAKCPETCKVTELSMSLATMATQLGTQTSSLLLRDKTINVGISTFDSGAVFMAPAFQQAGLPLISTNGLPANLDMVRSGGAQIADVSYPPADYNGWILLDQAARAALKQDVTLTKLPMQLFDKANIPANNEFGTLWPGLVDYQKSFLGLWGL